MNLNGETHSSSGTNYQRNLHPSETIEINGNCIIMYSFTVLELEDY